VADADSTLRLAAFAAERRPFPADVEGAAKRLVLDQFARQIAAAALPWSSACRDAVRALGAGSGATSVFFGDALAVDNAAFVNGALGYGNDVVDATALSAVEVGATIVPAVVALAEQRRCSGRALLDGVVAGAEVMVRIAAAATPQLHLRGHDVPPAAGPFGAAAGCARLLGFTPVQTENAMAIAGSHAGGLLEYGRTGGSVARMHCGIPAMWGVRSALMAEAGITGPRHVLEGERGFLAVFAGVTGAPLLAGALGERYALRDLTFNDDLSSGDETQLAARFAARIAGRIGGRQARELAAALCALERTPNVAELLALTHPTSN
jgi:2-methylcitrate dehydratase PrpD